MALQYIINYFAAKTGQINVLNDASLRSVALVYINNGAQEVYRGADLPGCLGEVYVNVLADKRIALPPFIGDLRAARDANLKLQQSITTMMPRYTGMFWSSFWRNWRFIGFSPLAQDLTSVGPLTFRCGIVPNISVTITGQSDVALVDQETVVLGSTSTSGIKNWINITSIVATAKSAQDVNILDGSDVQVATLYSAFTYVKYQIYDVSLFPSYGPQPNGGFMIELLFKKPLFDFVNDTDEFPVPDCDTIVARKAVQLWMEDNVGQEQRAQMLDQRILRDIDQLSKTVEDGQEKKMKFGPSFTTGIRRWIRWGYHAYDSISK